MITGGMHHYKYHCKICGDELKDLVNFRIHITKHLAEMDLKEFVPRFYDIFCGQCDESTPVISWKKYIG